MRTFRRTTTRVSQSAFTLIELLVVMAVIIVLAVVTLVAVRALAQDARQIRAVNAIKAALGNARAEAMRLNRQVGVVCRGLESGEVELVIVVDTGQASRNTLGDGRRIISHRYVALPDTPRTVISEAVRIATPFYGTSNDNLWITQSDFTQPAQAYGRLIGVFFGPDGALATDQGGVVSGSFITSIPSHVVWIDWNNNGVQDYNGSSFFEHQAEGDEVDVNPAPILAVFDYKNAREFFDTTLWNDWPTMTNDLSAYIDDRGDIIQFNRYTGVMTK